MEVQFIYIKARQKPEITSELIRKAAEIVYTKESTMLAIDAFRSNLLFPIDASSSREIATYGGKSTTSETHLRLEDGNVTVADFADFTNSLMVFEIYTTSIQTVNVRRLPYNWESVKKAVIHVCKLKSSKSKNQAELVAAVLQYLERKNTDCVGRKSPAKKKLVNIDSLENLFPSKK